MLLPLLEKINGDMMLDLSRLKYPNSSLDKQSQSYHIKPLTLIGSYMDAYGLVARDAFELMDTLQTCLALTTGMPLHAPYLLPLIVSQMTSGIEPIPNVVKQSVWQFSINAGRGRAPDLVTIASLAAMFHHAQAQSEQQLRNNYNSENPSYVESQVAQLMWDNPDKALYAHPNNYRTLLRTVARFASQPIAPATETVTFA